MSSNRRTEKTNTLCRKMLLILMAALIWFPETSRAASQELDKVIEGAKKEGELVYYASMSLQEATAMIPRFEKKYPFLKVRLNRTGSENVLTKVTAEARAKKYLADVIQTVEFSMYTLRKAGILSPYQSTEDSFFPKEFKEQGYWITAYCNVYVIGYNTKLVPKDQAPKTYEDLLKYDTAGKV